MPHEGKPFRIHDGTIKVEQFRRLDELLIGALEADAAETELGIRSHEIGEGVNRERIRQAFGQSCLNPADYDIPWEAAEQAFLEALEEFHEEDLPLLIKLWERYPTGWVGPEMLSLEEFLEEIGCSGRTGWASHESGEDWDSDD